jgi:Zn-dependent peptidase ImmA (M78 family)
MNVKFIPEKRIDEKAFDLLSRFGAKFPDQPLTPVPVDEIAECYLELELKIEELNTCADETKILGATWIEQGLIAIDQSLEPESNPNLLGRYRFTLAHEIGHWVLHRRRLLESKSAPLFDKSRCEAIVCRDGSNEPIEVQANKFAALLLMPEYSVKQEWQLNYGSSDIYEAWEEIEDIRARFSLSPDTLPAVERAQEMAVCFDVSAQAMMIKLVNMGLIRTQKPQRMLF